MTHSTAAKVISLLAERGETFAVAESLTGGLIGATVTEVPGASAAFVGGVISYATDLKRELLGVLQKPRAAHRRADRLDAGDRVHVAGDLRDRVLDRIGVHGVGLSGIGDEGAVRETQRS